jgi:hypothetical protein
VAEVVVKSLIWIVLILLVGFLGSIVWVGASSGAWSHIHGDNDARLVGKWRGELWPRWYHEKKPWDTVTFELKQGGEMKILEAKHFKGATLVWGTHKDEVQFKYLAVDYWPTPKFRFSLSGGDTTVTLDNKNSLRIPTVWKRVP